MSSHATSTSEHYLKVRETIPHRDQEPSSISIKVLRSSKAENSRCVLVHVDIFLNLLDYTALLLTMIVLFKTQEQI